MTSKFSRAALIAGLAIGASGLVAVPAEAANGISTANYYVNGPVVTGAANITPESAVVSGAVDTGGNPETQLTIPASGLTWNANSDIVIGSGIKWVNNTTGTAVPVDGLPASGSNSNVSVTITDSGDPAISGIPMAVSNGGADNYSDVTFEYDPVSDYDPTTGQPGVDVQQAQDIQVPTAAGLSSVSTTIGAFGQAAQNNTGNTPLTPGTKYYYWIFEQAGGTDQAVNINVAKWANTATAAVPAYNPSYKCYPIAAIEQDPTLDSYYQAYLANQNLQVSYPDNATDYANNVDVNEPAVQGPCYYYYGNTSGGTYYQSPNGTFTTPPLGVVKIGAKAVTAAKGVELAMASTSAYKASGTVLLTVGGKLAGTVKFALAPKAKGDFKIVLTKKGKAAASANKTAKVVPVSALAAVASVSNWDQKFVGKSVKL